MWSRIKIFVPAWTVRLKHSAIDDLDSLGPMAAKAILRAARERLAADPLATTRHLKSLRPNAIAERQTKCAWPLSCALHG